MGLTQLTEYLRAKAMKNKVIYTLFGKIEPDELGELLQFANMGPYSIKQLNLMILGSIYVTARTNNCLIGFGRMYSDKGTIAYINNMAVHPDFRGKGIGQRILSTLMENAGDVNSIYLYTNTADALYKRNNFLPSEKRLYVYRFQE